MVDQAKETSKVVMQETISGGWKQVTLLSVAVLSLVFMALRIHLMLSKAVTF